MSYEYSDLVSAYRALGVKRGDTISLKTGLRPLGAMETEGEDALHLHLKALDEVLDFTKGTVVVASTTTNLCDTETPFSLEETPGTMGVLTERVRNAEGAIRSYHAFESYSSLGGGAEELFEGLSRHAYGIDTPESRLVESDARCISLGLPVTVTCSFVHHMEMVMGVPYRYVREYNHPVKNADGKIVKDVFYRHPWYRESGVQKSYVSFFKEVAAVGFEHRRVRIGDGFIEGYRLRDLQHTARLVLRKDIYAVLADRPLKMPWRH